MNVFGICVVARASEIREERRVAVCIDSFPPFRIAAFPTRQLCPPWNNQLTRLDSESSDIDYYLRPSLEDD
jgi:hypothetical protein